MVFVGCDISWVVLFLGFETKVGIYRICRKGEEGTSRVDQETGG
jgi:hypothetical protein